MHLCGQGGERPPGFKLVVPVSVQTVCKCGPTSSVVEPQAFGSFLVRYLEEKLEVSVRGEHPVPQQSNIGRTMVERWLNDERGNQRKILEEGVASCRVEVTVALGRSSSQPLPATT